MLPSTRLFSSSSDKQASIPWSGGATAYTSLGSLLYRSGDSRGALDAFLKAREADPADPDMNLQLIARLAELGNATGAHEALAETLRLAEVRGDWPITLSLTGLKFRARPGPRLDDELGSAKRYAEAGGSARVAELPRALQRVRELENTTGFVERRWNECISWGPDVGSCTYGSTFFDGWLEVFFFHAGFI